MRENDPCSEYVYNWDWCGKYDDEDFDSYLMCCACGGGNREERWIDRCEQVEISIDFSLAQDFASFDENTLELIFDTDKEDVVGSYKLMITLTNSAGYTEYPLDVIIDLSNEVPDPDDEDPDEEDPDEEDFDDKDPPIDTPNEVPYPEEEDLVIDILNRAPYLDEEDLGEI